MSPGTIAALRLLRMSQDGPVICPGLQMIFPHTRTSLIGQRLETTKLPLQVLPTVSQGRLGFRVSKLTDILRSRVFQ